MIFNEHVKIREEKFGTVVFETLKEKVFVTNETGKEILNLLKTGKSQDEIVTALESAYGNDTGEVGGDVRMFIEQLVTGGIIKNEA